MQIHAILPWHISSDKFKITKEHKYRAYLRSVMHITHEIQQQLIKKKNLWEECINIKYI